MNEYDNMIKDYLVGYCRGSRVYDTFEEGVSDEDYLYVVPDCYSEFLSQFPKGIGQYTASDGSRYNGYIDLDGDLVVGSKLPDIQCDYEFVTESTFLQMIDNNDIVALEAIFVPNGMWFGLTEKHFEYQNRFKLDLWKLRECVSSICSNSWVKCKKKLTVEKDYNLRIAQKSLFHSMRIYMFGVQLAKNGRIVDYSCAKQLWYDISKVEEPTWEYYKTTYQKKFNELRSELVELCPKPEEKFKK